MALPTASAASQGGRGLPVPRGLRRLPFCVPLSSPVPKASGAAGGCAAAREGISPPFLDFL